MSDFSISVIITTYRRENYILRAIDSVRSQECVSIEIVVVDDDPDSTLFEILKSRYSNLVVYHQNSINEGPAVSRKWGLRHSNAPFVVFMDDDDFYTENYAFMIGLRHLQKNTNLAFVGFNARDYDEEHKSTTEGIPFQKNGVIKGSYYLKHFDHGLRKPKSTFTSIFSREKLIEAGVERVTMLNDTVIYLRSLLAGDAYIDAKTVGCYRIHDSNITKTISEKFIVDNLKEKVLICEQLPFTDFEKSIWLYHQAADSIFYYLTNSMPGQVNKKKLLRGWFRQQNTVVKICLGFKWVKYELHKITKSLMIRK